MSDPFKDVEAEVSGEESPVWKFWQSEIGLARKRERRFRDKAKRVNELYEADHSEDNSFNILYANTETLLPAIYNQPPRPLVERRFKDTDPIGLQVSTVMERTLQYLIDSPDAEYERYDDLFRQAGLAALVPGRGVTWWAYDPKIEAAPPSVGDVEGEEEQGGQLVAAKERVSGAVLPEAGERVTWETVCGEVVEYDKFLCGYARRWKNVPWVAREHAMTKEDAEENFGAEVAETLEYLEDGQEGEKRESGSDDRKNQGSLKTACVYEIWWKSRKQVVFFAPSRKEGLCRDPLDDPYGLTGFFPCCEPLQFLKKTTSLVPTPIYFSYEPQAKELNRLSVRINRILNAMKVRGFYDNSVGGLQELLSKDDNTLIPAKNVASMKEGAGANLANSIWFMPLEQLVKVVRELYIAREQTKQVIYEITGIADIMRGNTQASETATAQNIKDKWGGLRLQNMQGAMQGYIRDCLRIVAELAGRHFGLQTFAGMTNLDYATPEQLQRAEALTQAINAAMGQMQQPSPDPSAPPPAPPPQVQQAMQEVESIRSKPSWEPVLAILKDNIQRGYKVDIETNSTLANTNAEDQDNINKAMQAIAQVMQQFVPAVQAGIMTMAALKEMLLSVARRFEFGRQVETAIQQMPDQAPPPPQVQQEAEKAQQEVQQKEQEMQKQAHEAEMAAAAADQELKGREADLARKEQEVAAQIKNTEEDIARQVKQAKDEMTLEQEKFMVKVEMKFAKAGQVMPKGIMAKDKERESKVNKDLADLRASDRDTRASVLDTMQKLTAQMQELLGERQAPIEFVKGPDRRTAQVKIGNRTRTVRRNPQTGDIEGLH